MGTFLKIALGFSLGFVAGGVYVWEVLYRTEGAAFTVPTGVGR
jgi:hypothetical protein